jgi:CRP-like cAMP-binding protein
MNSFTRYPTFGDVPEVLLRDGIERRHPKGSVIIRPGEYATGCYYVKEGTVQSYHLSEEGNLENIIYLVPKSIFLESNVLIEEKSAYFFETLEDCLLTYIPYEVLTRLMQEDSQVALYIACSISWKLHYSIHKFRSFQELGSLYRTVETLLDIARHHGVESCGRIRLNVRFSQQYLAELIGTSRVTAMKNINRLKAMGLVEKTNDDYYLTDFDRLSAFLDILSLEDGAPTAL